MAIREVARHEPGEIDWNQVNREVLETSQPSNLDKAILSFSPAWGRARLRARHEAGYERAKLAIIKAYNTVWPTRDRESTFLPLGTEDALLPGWDRYQILQEARQLYRNDPIIRALVDGVAKRVGPKPDFHTSNEKWNEEALKQYTNWAADLADFTGEQTLDEMDESIVKAQYTDGDIGEIYVNQGGDLRLQLIESDRIAPDQRININIDTMNPMAGVWVDWNTGRVYGYQVGKRGVGGLLVDSEFVPKTRMGLYKRTMRVEQRRGIPLLQPVINPAKDFANYLNAVRISMNAAAQYGVFVKTDNAAQIALAQSQPVSNKPYRIEKMINGRIVHLNVGESVDQLNPTVPGPDFDPVSRMLIKIIARGGGSIYELLMGDFHGMSYSASKTVLQFVWQMQDDWEDWLIRTRKRRVYERWVSLRMTPASEGGLGSLPFNAEAFDKVTWIRSLRVGFDPLEDAEAIVKLIGAGALTYRRFYASLGLNERTELMQSANEAELIYKTAKEKGIPPEAIASTLAPGVMATGDSPNTPSGPGTTRRGGAED